MGKAVVGIIFNDDNQVLLGKATSNDFRNGKLCFIGGGVEKDETLEQAIVRESKEEGNIDITPDFKNKFYVNERVNVIYLTCKYISGIINPNNEFEYMGWYNLDSLPKDILPLNKEILNKLGYLKEK